MNRLSEAEPDPHGKKPLARNYGKDLLFLDIPGFLRTERWKGFFKRYREDFFGFLIAWGMVVVLIFLAGALMQIGG